ncbi:hypothetical protein KP509_20G056700 [Ceratopteris richardii]|uniref:Uncharacterized protein n=1 Tax=Ceratopteris richardii TaxID=49495 RepID=A0A8T2SHB9_CERRI|nr:hypothetical protein KP509_20G056700 [Ceratopteris richardii]
MVRKIFISEGDVSQLLRRYTANTILTLLREIYCADGTKLDWRSMVKNTNTGIDNPKEYQTLWRHFAYGAMLQDSFEDDAEPLDDESDLDCEVEPFPAVSPDIAANVAACVKALAATGSMQNVSSRTQEASFLIDIPNSSSGWEVRGNGQISNVIIQGANTPETQPARKKRKLWTSEEDQELIAAVEKCGEGNWATMLKGAFKHERTAAQLSQRWALIRKRRDSQTVITQSNTAENQVMPTGAINNQLPVETVSALVPPGAPAEVQRDSTSVISPSGAGNLASVPTVGPKNMPISLSQDQQVNNGNAHAFSQATGKGRPPIKRYGVTGLQHARATNPSPGLLGSSSGQGAYGMGDNGLTMGMTAAPSASGSGSGANVYNVPSSVRNSAVIPAGRPAPKSSAGPDPMIQAAAVAAGARIAPASAAASLLKAACSGNIVHIGPGGVAMGKARTQNQTSGNPTASNIKGGFSIGSRTSAGPIVHYSRSGTRSSQTSHSASQRSCQITGQVVQNVRSGSSMTPPGSSGLSSASCASLQKTQVSTLTPVSSTEVNASFSTVPSTERSSSANDVIKAGDHIDGNISSISEGVKDASQDSVTCKTPIIPINSPAEGASECLQMGQNSVCGKVCLTDNNILDQNKLSSPGATVIAKDDPATALSVSSGYDKADSLNDKGDTQNGGLL